MKKLLSIASTGLFIVLAAVAITTVFHTDIVNTTIGVAAVIVPTNILNVAGLLPMPVGVLGTYIGAPGVTTEEGTAGVQVINSERARGAYMAYKTNPKYAGNNITQSYLRLESVVGNDSRITFKTFAGDGTTVAPTENRLDRNDKFVITEIGLFLMKQDKSKPGSGRLLTYPNIIEFGATAAGYLESIFNGNLGITINRKKWLPLLDTQRFLQVPQTQQSGSGNRDMRSMRHAMVRLTPHIEIDGSGTNEIEIQFPIYSGWAGGTPAVNTDEHRVVLYAHGLLINQGSENT